MLPWQRIEPLTLNLQPLGDLKIQQLEFPTLDRAMRKLQVRFVYLRN